VGTRRDHVTVMTVLNIHHRSLDCSEDEVGTLIDKLASDEDHLWPTRLRWPAMFFDRPLGVGAVGGHGPMRYSVSDYEPGKWIRFTYTWPRKFNGFHEFTVNEDAGGRQMLLHRVAIEPRGFSRLLWWTYVRPLHDACLEDSLDCAELAVSGTVARPARRSRYVHLLYLMRIRRIWP
jgi:hypothetical protein